jgi:hypothetical protein
MAQCRACAADAFVPAARRPVPGPLVAELILERRAEARREEAAMEAVGGFGEAER